MEKKCRAVVLASQSYKEKDKLVTLYTLEYGILTVVLKSVLSPNAKLRACKEPFVFGEYVIADGKGYDIVTSCEIIETFHGITQNIDLFVEAGAVLEIVKIVSGNGSEPMLFVSLLKALKALEGGKIQKKYVLSKFLIEIFDILGYKLSMQRCQNCKEPLRGDVYFNVDLGEMVCSSCRSFGSIRLSTNVLGGLRLLSITEYEKLESLKLVSGIEEDVLKILRLNFSERFSKEFGFIEV